MVVTNLVISSCNITRVLVRLRDKNPEIRAIILRKLNGEKYHLLRLSQSNVYKILYDAYGNKDAVVKN